MKKSFLSATFAVAAAVCGSTHSAFAQQAPQNYQLRDDVRDLRRFERLSNEFDQAIQQRNVAGVRQGLTSFVQAGRDEVNELQNELRQAQSQPQRWGGRRDFNAENARLQRATGLLQELERVAVVEASFGPQRQTLDRARQVMNEFVQLSREELGANQQGGTAVVVAPAQPPVPPPQPAQPAQPAAGYALRDDIRDLRRFEQLQRQFDTALARRDASAVQTALNSFVQAGREEVTELQNELQSASQSRDPRWRRRNFRTDTSRLQRATALVQQLERAAAVTAFNGRRTAPAIASARSAMTQFVQLSRQQLASTQLH